MSSISDRSLLVIILDVSPTTWGERELRRTQSDRARAAKGKRSAGPAKLEEVVSSVLSFGLAFSALHRENGIVVIGVAGSCVGVLYPRKGGHLNLGQVVEDPPEMGCKIDAKQLHDGLKLGVAYLISQASSAATAPPPPSSDAASGDSQATKASNDSAAMASALSMALCLINRFHVAAGGGVSALASNSFLNRGGDEGVLSILGDHNQTSQSRRAAAEAREERRRARGMLTPRVLLIQASDDRTRDYNALMNCAFAANKADVTLDGCFIPSGASSQPKSHSSSHGNNNNSHAGKTSPFLEQLCDRTGGVYLAPPEAAQVGGLLTEVFMSVFLAPISARRRMNLPTLSKVDFRARCFESGECVDLAHVCNQCLSIFKNRPKDACPTCGATITQKAVSGNAGMDVSTDATRSTKRIRRS